MSLSLLPLLSFVCFFLSLSVCVPARAQWKKSVKWRLFFFCFSLFLVNSNNLVETPKLVKSEEIINDHDSGTSSDDDDDGAKNDDDETKKKRSAFSWISDVPALFFFFFFFESSVVD